MFNTVPHAVPTLHYSGEEETGAHSMFLWHSSSRERGVAGVAFHSTLIVNQSSTYSTAVTSQLPPQRSSTLGSGHTTTEQQKISHIPLSHRNRWVLFLVLVVKCYINIYWYNILLTLVS